MLQKAAASAADHVFCDLEDAVAPAAKVEARTKVCWALNNLDWGRKTRCVRINDVTTEWCHGDLIEVVEKAGANLDTIMLTKPYSAADVIFVDRMLTQHARLTKIFEGTSEIQQHIISDAMLGKPTRP
jgi:citrate lyase subunit beta/citryl-CoA lyase